MKTTLTILALATVSGYLAAPAIAAVTLSGLAENFDASVGTNTPALWENQVGSQDFVPHSAGGGITLGSVTSLQTTINTAYSFNGSSGFTSSGGNPFTSTDNSNSFEIWFRPNSMSAAGVLFETGGGTGAHIVLDGAGNVGVYAEGTASDLTYTLNLTNLGYDPTTDFTQVVLTADASDGTTGTSLYVNGSLISQGPAANWNGTGNNDGLATSGGGQTGGLNGATSANFVGDIAIFRVYDDILTASEVNDNHSALLATTAIPEPSSLALLGLGGLLLTRRRRRD